MVDIEVNDLLVKSRITNKPGLILVGNPPRWHKLSPGEAVPQDTHHALHKKGEVDAVTKLSKDPEFKKLSAAEQIKKVQEHAKAVQDKNTASAKVSLWKQKILSGKNPATSEWKAFLGMPKDKRAALYSQIKANPESAALFEAAAVKYRMEAVDNIIARQPDEQSTAPAEEQPSQTAPEKSQAKAQEPTKPGDATEPGDQKKTADDVIENGKQAEAKTAQPDGDTKDSEHDAKIQEYATGATYKQKAHKLLAQDPAWQNLSGPAKLEALHNKYLELQSAASLSGAMAKFKAALLSGKTPTKALVEKFNGLSKDDQAKVLKPVFAQKDKTEIGKLLEQAGAGNAPKPESRKAGKPERSEPVKADSAPIETKKTADADTAKSPAQQYKDQLVQAAKQGDGAIPLPQGVLAKKPIGMTATNGGAVVDQIEQFHADGDVGKLKNIKDNLFTPVLGGKILYDGIKKKAVQDYLDAAIQDLSGQPSGSIPVGANISKKWFVGEDGLVGKYQSAKSYGVLGFGGKKALAKKGSPNPTSWSTKAVVAQIAGAADAMVANGVYEWVDVYDSHEEAKAAVKASKTVAKQGPQDGDTKPGANGTLIFKDGRWHVMGKDGRPTAESFAAYDRTKLPPANLDDLGLTGDNPEWFSVGDGKYYTNGKVAMVDSPDHYADGMNLSKQATHGGKAYVIDNVMDKDYLDPAEPVGIAYQPDGDPNHSYVVMRAGDQHFAINTQYFGLIDKTYPKAKWMVDAANPSTALVAVVGGKKVALVMGVNPDLSVDISGATKAALAPPKTQPPSKIALEAKAFELGKAAFKNGMQAAPALDAELSALLPGVQSEHGHAGVMSVMTAWQKGWVQANLDAPLPEAVEPEADHGANWVAALAGGKKPDPDDDNAVMVMPVEQYAALESKAASAWARNQGLVGDPNGQALGLAIVADLLGNIAHGEGDTKTVNGATYILKDGHWHRLQDSTPMGPAEKLAALQDMPIAELIEDIKDGKIGGQIDKLLDVTAGPEGKATFYSMVADHQKSSSGVYLQAAVAAAYGHPGEVLNKHHQWVPFDPEVAAIDNASLSAVQNVALEETALSAQDKPSKGPENPDTPQTFGNGTVTFTGPTTLHNALQGKSWGMSSGFQAKFIKGAQDWSISPDGWTDDKSLWKKQQWYLRDMFPEGATVNLDGIAWKVAHGAKSLDFTNPLTGEKQSYATKQQVNDLLEVMFDQNPTIVPPGHPDGKLLNNPVTGKIETDSPAIKPDGSSVWYKKIDSQWHFRISPQGEWHVATDLGNFAALLEGKLAEVTGVQHVASTDSTTPAFAFTHPGGTTVNYKKVDGQWMTEDEQGNPKTGWHAINQSAWFIEKLEGMLASEQGDQYSVMDHPAVKSYIQEIASGHNPGSALPAIEAFKSTKQPGGIDDMIKAAAGEYAKTHGLKVSDPDDMAVALDIATDLAYGDPHPKEGDTITKNGHTYQLINGRWHRVDKDAVKAARQAGVDVHPVDAVVIDDGYKTAAKAPDKIESGLQILKDKAKAEGLSAWKGIIAISKAKNQVTIKMPYGDGLGVIKLKVSLDSLDNPDATLKPWLPKLAKGILDMKEATKLAEGKKPKKPSAPKPAKTTEPFQPVSQPVGSKTVKVGNTKAKLIDDWAQTGPQGGSNPGGQFTDKLGKKWYCKFPDNPDVCRNEYLATKLYQMLGMSVPDMVLVQKDGKLGVGTKWVDGLKKGSAEDLAQAPGAHEGFVIDAWLANWDVIGLANDNLLLGKDGKALRADAGGALIYRAQGGPKGDAFGNEVTELDTLTNPAKNPQAAAVFGGITKDKMEHGLSQLNKLKPSQIEELVDAIGPGTDKERRALAKKLIARRADILKKFNIRDQWDKKPPDITKLTVNPADLPEAIDFNNLDGKPVSSIKDINDANTAASQALIDFAAQGNLEALKNYEFSEYDKNTKSYTSNKISIEKHPSQHIQKQWAGLVQMLQSIAYPPADTLEMPPLGVGETPEEIAREIGSFAPDKNISNIPPEHVLGYFMKLGQVSSDVVESLKTAADWHWTSPTKNPAFFSKLKGVYAKARNSVKSYIGGVQSSGAVNHIWSQGKRSWQGNSINQLTADIYADAVEVEEGTQMWRWMDDDTAGKMMTKQFLDSHPGDILQNTDSMCTSFHEHWGDSPHFVSNQSKAMLMRIRCAKGVKMTPTYATGSLGSEGEFTTLPGQRFIVIDIKKGGKHHPDGVFLDVIALPPDDGFVAQLGAASES